MPTRHGGPDYFTIACDITRAYKETLMGQAAPEKLCSCGIRSIPGVFKSYDIVWCPLHAAAPAMRDLVQRIFDMFVPVGPMGEWQAEARALLAATRTEPDHA